MKKFLASLMLLVMFAPFALRADEIIVGNGTSTTEGAKTEDGIVFFYDFNNSTMDGWTAIDKDGDGNSWQMYLQGGLEGTDCVSSWTWGSLDPENYLITTETYTINNGDYLEWYLNTTDAFYHYDIYGVVVSTDGENFTTVMEENIAAATVGYEVRTADLSQYAGQTVHIGFVHKNGGYNSNGIAIDNVKYVGSTNTEEPEQPVDPEEPVDPEQPELAEGELVIGDGTYQTSVAPFRNSYCNSWVEAIYPLNEIGNQAFTINSIAYNCATVGVTQMTLSNVYVYIGETTRSEIASSSDWTPESDLTLVYSGSDIVIGEEEWETFVLDTPYEFSGTKNLVIAVGKASAQYNNAVKWYYVPTDNNSIMYINDDYNASFANYPTNNGSASYQRPNVKLGYSNATTPDPVDPEEPEVELAEGDTWQNAIEVTSYPFTSTPDFANLNNDYSLPGSGSNGPDAAYKLTFAEETTINATVTGANAKVALYAENFNGEDGPGTGNYYVPGQAPSNTSFFYDFNDQSMNGWRTIDQDNDTYAWEVSDGMGTYTGYEGTPCLHSDSYIGAALYPDNYVVTTTAYDISEGSELKWLVKPQDASSGYCNDHYAVVGSTDGISFLEIWEETLTPSYNFEERTVSLDYFAGQTVYIGFRHYMCNGSNATGVLVDNVELTSGTTEEPETPVDPEQPEGLTSFMFDFNDSDLSAFTTIDADGDGQNWNCYGYGIEGSSLASESYIIGVGILNPDNYIYTNEKYTITAESVLTYDVYWQYGEYYSVIVSTDGENFTNVFEEGVTGTGQGYSDSKTIDLSAYAGQEIHIGLRHYNCSDGLRLMFDSFTLTDGNEEPEQPENPENPEEGATTFLFNFNDQTLDGFSLNDADGDGMNWQIFQYGIDGASAQSHSYHPTTYADLTPDNYLTTANAYSITATSQLKFKVNTAWAEYYGVAVSEDNETFTMVYEENYQGTVKEVTVDLSAYAGKNLYIAIRHYNCSGGYMILIDDLELTTGAKRSENRDSKTIEMTVPAGTYYLVASATEAFTVDINTVENNEEEENNGGLNPVAQVVAVENGNNVDVAWSWESMRRLAIADAKTGETKYINRDSEQGYNFHSYRVYRANGNNNPVIVADYISETSFQDATWAQATSGVYRWGVAAMYTAQEDETEEGRGGTIYHINEDFESCSVMGKPEGWTTYSVPSTANQYGNWAVLNGLGIYTPYAGSNAMYSVATSNEANNYYLVTPAIDLSRSLSPTLEFKYITPGLLGGESNLLRVMYSESPTGPWTELWNNGRVDNSMWNGQIISLSELSGKTIYVAFNMEDYFTFGVGIDNVVLSAIESDGPIPVASEIVWSNSIDKDMITSVAVNITADDNASVAGTTVTLANVNEPAYVYETTLDATGQYTWTEFRKGTYELTIALDGYYSCATAEIMEIAEATTIECTLEKMPEIISGLYVSPTAWAMWNNNGTSFNILLDGTTVAQNVTDKYYQLDVTSLVEGQEYKTTVMPNGGADEMMEYTWTYRSCSSFVGVTNLAATVENGNPVLTWTLPEYVNVDPVYEFATNFDNGALYGWRTLDGDGDGNTWKNTSEFANQGFGVNDTYCAASMSYDNQYGALYPNNYLVTEIKYTMTADSKLTYDISSHDRTYDAEHYAVAVSTTGYEPGDFTIIFEETLNAGAPAYEGALQGEWFNREIDLSSYAGLDIYIAFRHYNCTNQAWVKLDNVSLTSSAKRDDNGEWLFYDSGVNESAFGMMDYNTWEPTTFNWAIMFPADIITAYHGTQITKVSLFVYDTHEGAFSIHKGGEYAPGTMVHVQTYNATDSFTYQEFELTTPITVDATENLWIQFSNTTGYYVAAHSADCGDPNSRWISTDDGATWFDSEFFGTGWYGSWQIRAYVEGEGSEPGDDNNNGNANAEVLGTMIYRDGQLLTAEPFTSETYVDAEITEGEHEYAVRVVYDGASDVTYYAMSCPQEVTVNIEIEEECAAPENLFGQYRYNEDGTFGAELIWPYSVATSEWLYYDNGVNQDGIGGPASFYWGIMFPAASLNPYNGSYLTKVSIFDFAQSEGDINIYYGGTTAPGTLVHTQPYATTGVGAFVEYDLTSALPIDITENLWVIFSTGQGTNYPASCCSDTGDPNGRWISMDGAVWEDVASYGLYDTWMIRAMVSSSAKAEVSELKALDYEYTASEGSFVAMGESRGETFEHYNIYRGTSANNFEKVGESTEGTYFDEVAEGTYYYQVTAVYTNNGEECESEPASAYNSDQNYVVVEVTAINENGVNGMMIYPNPTKDNLNITAEGMTNITITNALGQVMYNEEVVSDNQIINMAQYEAGIYMVRITTENGVTVKQVTVVK